MTQELNKILNLDIQVAVRRDLVKVNDPSLKKAPPDSEEFGDGASCRAQSSGHAELQALARNLNSFAILGVFIAVFLWENHSQCKNTTECFEFAAKKMDPD